MPTHWLDLELGALSKGVSSPAESAGPWSPESWRLQIRAKFNQHLLRTFTVSALSEH